MNRNKIIAVMLMTVMLISTISGCSAKNNAGNGSVAESSAISNGTTSADDEYVLEIVKTDAVSNVVINSHTVEEITGSEYGEQYSTRDIVSITYSAGDLDGMLPQTVSKDLEFYKNSNNGRWEFLKEKTTACEVDNTDLIGTSWKCESYSAEDLAEVFDGGIPAGDKGTLYIRFLKKMGGFAFNMDNGINTPDERFFVTVGTGAKIAWVGQEGIIEKNVKMTEGSVTNEGILNLVLGTGDGSVILSFGDNTVLIKDREYDMAVGIEADESKVYKDSLNVIEVTSEDAVVGAWNVDIGLKEGNLSPELTWEAVDGAGCYAVFMIDVSTNTWLMWYVIVDTTHFDKGRYTDSSEYVGPYPPGAHDFIVYVVALKDEPKISSYPLDQVTGDIDDKLNVLNTAADGSIGNVLAYGSVKATYTSPELYYDYR